MLESVQKEYKELEGLYQYYHYVRQRNEAQIDSFIDENAQWEAQDPYDKDIIINHPKVVARMEELDLLMKGLSPPSQTIEHEESDEGG